MFAFLNAKSPGQLTRYEVWIPVSAGQAVKASEHDTYRKTLKAIELMGDIPTDRTPFIVKVTREVIAS